MTEQRNLPDFWNSLTVASPLPTVCLERDEPIVRYANPSFCRLVQKPSGQVIGQMFASVVPADEECLALLERVYRTGLAETYVPRQTATHPLGWSCVMWPGGGRDGRHEAVIVQVTDPLHRHAAAMNQALLVSSVRQHELADAAVTLNVQLRSEIVERQRVEEILRHANADLNQFAFAAAHDLQQPLRMIAVYSQLLVERSPLPRDGDAEDSVTFITDGVQQMMAILTDLLSYAEMGAAGADTTEWVDLNSVVQKVLQNLKPAIDEAGAVITVDPLPMVRGHGSRFIQVFQNLIGNGIKYRGPLPLCLHVSADHSEGAWRIAVADNGMGIDPRFSDTIFTVFKRLHGSAIPGTGLGLAICQRVIENYGGRIWVESTLDRGSTFYFTLPAAMLTPLPG